MMLLDVFELVVVPWIASGSLSDITLVNVGLLALRRDPLAMTATRKLSSMGAPLISYSSSSLSSSRGCVCEANRSEDARVDAVALGNVLEPLPLIPFCVPPTLGGDRGIDGVVTECDEIGGPGLVVTGGVLDVALSGDWAGEGDFGLNTLGEESLLTISTRSSLEKVRLLVSFVLVDVGACRSGSAETAGTVELTLAAVAGPALFLVNVSLLLTGVGEGAGLLGKCLAFDDRDVRDRLLALQDWRFDDDSLPELYV